MPSSKDIFEELEKLKQKKEHLCKSILQLTI